MNLIDTHCHITSSRFAEDIDDVIARMHEAGLVNAVVVADPAEENSVEKVRALVEKHDFLYWTIGVHPENADKWCPEIEAILREGLSHPKCVGVGEIGLDYYWQDNPPREFQEWVFRKQIELALELDLPVIVHDREAHGDTMRVLFEYPTLRGVVHCFSGSPEMARELVKRGWYLGFDGPITYKNAKKGPEVLAETPLDRIVIETDAPYLTPVPFRGKRNDSRLLTYVIEKLAEWKNVSPEEMERITWENGLRLYGLEGKI